MSTSNKSSLQIWNDHIYNQNTFSTFNNISKSKTNIFGPLTDYLSTPAIFDFFNFFEDNKTTIFPLHNLLNNNNSSFNTNELLRISTNTNLNNSFNTNIDTFF